MKEKKRKTRGNKYEQSYHTLKGYYINSRVPRHTHKLNRCFRKEREILLLYRSTTCEVNKKLITTRTCNQESSTRFLKVHKWTNKSRRSGTATSKTEQIGKFTYDHRSEILQPKETKLNLIQTQNEWLSKKELNWFYYLALCVWIFYFEINNNYV